MPPRRAPCCVCAAILSAVSSASPPRREAAVRPGAVAGPLRPLPRPPPQHPPPLPQSTPPPLPRPLRRPQCRRRGPRSSPPGIAKVRCRERGTITTQDRQNPDLGDRFFSSLHSSLVGPPHPGLFAPRPGLVPKFQLKDFHVRDYLDARASPRFSLH